MVTFQDQFFMNNAFGEAQTAHEEMLKRIKNFVENL